MNASVILAIVAILATAVIVTAVVFNRLATYKRGYEFFKERNPGYLHGDELVCLTEMSEGNLLRSARAAFLEEFR